MSNNLIPELSDSQFKLLCTTAASTMPAFLQTFPSKGDEKQRQKVLKKAVEEVKQLVKYGLVEDASEAFQEIIDEQLAKSGRKFKVFGLTEIGYLMFKDCENRVVN